MKVLAMGLSCMGELTVPDTLPPRWWVRLYDSSDDYYWSAKTYDSPTKSFPFRTLVYVRETYVMPDLSRVTVYVDDRITLR